jgi:hypothetical protein
LKNPSLRPSLTFITAPTSVGVAGSGKSKIIGAVLWHLYQHRASHLVAITSFTWKAAQLISTPANAGFSSMTTFGIPVVKRRNGPSVGDSEAARTIISRDVVLVFNDEISFTPQSHLAVSVRLY